ncbi:Regulatory protein UhpC [Poriferisphaera corsica]|uniref:Regulatory protein UhpC n=1 Tax=Poriferisphaera corsica TaxID=2528020 RepID=A0A517YVS7_9BACT|nr:MFS transporter [Poriferisphaera corsica]QDU34337.1 Regulatory protein UhpC [Poriferisphaera corsica]
MSENNTALDSQVTTKDSGTFIINHTPGFRFRRGMNWFALGLMYATYYMCRYNFRFATPGLRDEFGFDKTAIGDLFGVWALAYGTGQLINGLFSDRIGGKRCMLIGAIGTIIINFMFGFSPWVSSFTTFGMLSLLNGYMQSFGAPGMVKINAAWFHRTERGTFAGIFGIMIQLGQIAISNLAPFILSTTLMLGSFYLMKEGEWRYLFIIPPLFTVAAALFMIIVVKQSPDEAGFPGEIEDEVDNSEGTTVPLIHSLKTIFLHPLVWFYALAYACTGGVRHSLDNISILYFEEQLGFDMKGNIPWIVVITLSLMPIVAIMGSIGSGFISDKFFNGKRAPVAAVLYFGEACIIGLSAIILSMGWVSPTAFGIVVGCTILIMISLSVNSTHSLVGAAAPMDIGGKKMAGFAAGVIDSFQYYGAAISLFITGRVLQATEADYGYLFWYIIMAGFGILGGFCMVALVLRQRQLRAQGRVVSG